MHTRSNSEVCFSPASYNEKRTNNAEHRLSGDPCWDELTGVPEALFGVDCDFAPGLLGDARDPRPVKIPGCGGL